MMKTEVRCVGPEETVHDAARTMRDEGIGFLPVCDPSGRVVGTVTDRDLAIRVVAADCDPSTPVGDVMTQEVVACRPEDSLQDVQALMALNHKSRVMVLDEQQKLVGVISLSDIAQQDGVGFASRTLRQVSEREVRGVPYP